MHDWQKEQDKLLKEGGLGNVKHRKQVNKEKKRIFILELLKNK